MKGELMGWAYRSDVCDKYGRKIEELRSRNDFLGWDAVKCPVEGCDVSYRLSKHLLSSIERDRQTLEYSLRGHHPDHRDECFAVGGI